MCSLGVHALVWLATLVPASSCQIDRESIVRRFNIRVNQSHPYSPIQVGNGNFAFGVDVTGLQTFLPHNTLSSWAWHNSSLPTTFNQTYISDFTGQDWWTHGRLVNYDQPNPAQKDISQWLIANPHRINLGRVGLWFGGRNVSEYQLASKSQSLDLWTGTISSSFSLDGSRVRVKTIGSPDTDTVAVTVESELLKDQHVGIFFDFPYASGKNKFDAPFVGLFNATANHTTLLRSRKNSATITHSLDTTTYYTHIEWEGEAHVRRLGNAIHKYILESGAGINTLAFTVTYTSDTAMNQSTFNKVAHRSETWWREFWSTGAFVSLPTSNKSAEELQRRIILTRYLLAVNGAGKDPPQESGLVNNGWYGKFHMEMVFW